MRVFWAWVEGATGNMALALDSLVELVRSWATVGGLSDVGLASIMDTLNTLLVGWMVFVAFILILGTFFYFKFIYPTESGITEESEDAEPEGEPQGKKKMTEGKRPASGKSRSVAPPSEPARKPTIVPEVGGEPVSPPVATGADPDAVNWTNNVFTWLYNSADGGPAMRKIWLDTVNENTVKTAIEVSVSPVCHLMLLMMQPSGGVKSIILHSPHLRLTRHFMVLLNLLIPTYDTSLT